MSRTPGGHRRFTASDLRQFAERHRERQKQIVPEGDWAVQALDHTRYQIAQHRDSHWLQAGNESMHEAQRALGRRLMGVIMQYVSTANGDELLAEARVIGQEYAETNTRLGLSLIEALEAFLVFRDGLTEVALRLPDAAATRTDIATDLVHRLNRILNAVLLAMTAHYGE